jgi:hypothetical protein
VTARPKVQIIRTGTLPEVYVDGKYVTDDMDDFGRVVRELARALGADVEDAAEPDRQPYTYYVAYDWKGDGVQGVGYSWLTRPGAIESAADTDDIVARIRENSPKMKSVMITNFICTDGPC